MATRVVLSLSIVIVLIIFDLHTENVCISAAEEWYPPPICNWTANYTKDSQFVRNVKAALSSLRVNTVEDTSGQSMFNISEYGQSPNQIYALLQCRGDATVEQCNNCSEQAKTAAVVQDCANYIGSRVWSKFCFLRYNGNYNFTGKLDINGENETYNQHLFYKIDTIRSEDSPAVFRAAARELLSSLASDITSGSSRNRYASNTTLDSFRRIYGLAQCWGDISPDDCKTCLSTTIDLLFRANDNGTGGRGLTGNCVVQYDLKPFFNDSAHPASPPQRLQKSSSSKIPIILGVLGGSVILLLMVGLFATRTRWKPAIFSRHIELGPITEDSQVGEDQQSIPSMSNAFTLFELKTLAAATQNFHRRNKLGEGGFGPVYKGTTQDGIEIAVKKLSLKSMQGKKQFLNEVELVAKIQHRNLVKLLGCCAEGSERLLVYEYLPNNSLDKILFDPNKRRLLDWQERYNIIVGVTRGLLYLHEDSQLRIIHRDIKASNILLDDKLNPKIADFGLARLFVEDETNINTNIAGTRGYMAPEYAMQGQLSVKVDVYSFGVVVLELMSGRKSIDFYLPPGMDILLEWAWRLYKRGNLMDMIDPSIIETCNDQEQALRCIHIALLCTQAEASLRPAMSTINLMLSTKLVTLPEPTQPAFISSSVLTHNTKYTGTSGSTSHTSAATTSSSVSHASSHTTLLPPSNADVTISELEPR